jgi:acetoin utilization deacetylase AcuC-like enzyme
MRNLFRPSWPLWRRHRLEVFFDDDYLVGQTIGAEGLFDPLRPKRIADALRASPAARFIRWRRPEMASLEALRRIHDPAYLEKAGRPDFLAEVFPFHKVDPWDTDLWEAMLLVTGGTILALRTAVKERRPAANLSGGFHHAAPAAAAGFCVINDVAVAVADLRAQGFTGDIAIVDLDYHHGDGTEECLIADRRTWLLSVHPSAWRETGKRERIHRMVPNEVSDDDYLRVVGEGLAQLEGECTPAALVYVAGVDPWEEDLLTSMRLSEAALLRRDWIVADWCAARRIPYAIVPAGGYGPLAWRPTASFLNSLCTGRRP